jgi:hypothetical protein
MLNEAESLWLQEAYPGLVCDNGVIVGQIEFRARYDPNENRFFILGDEQDDTGGPGVVLSGTFVVRISRRPADAVSRLPVLYVEGIEAVGDRHFNPADQSACLCSLFDEDDFLAPDLKFRKYLEELVVPFLYGQLFYSSHKRWPWADFAHGVTGILEAYASMVDDSRAEMCVGILARYASDWPKIRSALQQEPYVKGHTPCFCPAKDKIRRCHPKALAGALLLQEHIEARKISIYRT